MEIINYKTLSNEFIQKVHEANVLVILKLEAYNLEGLNAILGVYALYINHFVSHNAACVPSYDKDPPRRFDEPLWTPGFHQPLLKSRYY